MAEEELGLIITGEDASKGAFESANQNIDKTEKNIGRMASQGVRHFRQMSGGVVSFGEALSSGNVPRAIMAFGGLIANVLRSTATQLALATAGISVLVGAIILGISKLRQMWADEEAAQKKAAEEAKKTADEIVAINEDMDKRIAASSIKSAFDQATQKADISISEAEALGEREKALLDSQLTARTEAAKEEIRKMGLDEVTERKLTAQAVGEVLLKAAQEKIAIDKRTADFTKKTTDNLNEFSKAEDQKALDEKNKALEEKRRKEKAAADAAAKEREKATEEEKRETEQRRKAFIDNIKEKEQAQNAIDKIAFEAHRKRLREIAEQEERERQLAELKVMVAMNAAGDIGSIAGNLNVVLSNSGKKQSRALFNIQKAATVAQIFITGQKAAMEAYAWGMALGGPIGAGILVGLAEAATATQVAAVTSQQPNFQTSVGQTRRAPGPSNRPMLATLHGGEMVSRGNSAGVSIVVQGNLYNEEQTYRVLQDGLRQYSERSGSSILPRNRG